MDKSPYDKWGPFVTDGPFVTRPSQSITPPIPFNVLTDENDDPLLDESDDQLTE